MTITEPQAKGPRLGWILGLTSTAYFMVVLDALVVITALPAMRHDLHAGLSTLQWTVNAYGIAFASGIVTGAALGDRLGRRRVFLWGLATFTIASGMCAIAPSASWLIAARTLQGLGAAAVLPLSLTILTEAFPIERRGAVVGVYGGLAGLAVAIGPLVGGAVTEGIDWHWIFWINVPIGMLALLPARRVLPETYGPPARLDLVGVVLVSAAVVGIVWGLVRGNDAGWTSPEIIGSLVAGSLFLVTFFAWERRAPAPILPTELLRIPAFVAGNATMFLMSGAIFSAAFLITEYFQLALGDSPLSTGVRLMPWFATPMLVAPLAGALSDRVGRRPLIVTGLLLQSVCFAWLSWNASLHESYAFVAVALLIAGVGISMALPTVPTAVLSSVEPQFIGKASGINYMMQRFGSVFAVAIGTSVFSAYGHLDTPAHVLDGFEPALVACTILSSLATIAALGIGPRVRRHQARVQTPEVRLETVG